jgi:hypothetical protein
MWVTYLHMPLANFMLLRYSPAQFWNGAPLLLLLLLLALQAPSMGRVA